MAGKWKPIMTRKREEEIIKMKHITFKKDFVELAKELKVRKDWHEPDEQEVDIVLKNGKFGFDNAMMDETEDHIIIKQNGKPVAFVNLAVLCAWASGYKS